MLRALTGRRAQPPFLVSQRHEAAAREMILLAGHCSDIIWEKGWPVVHVMTRAGSPTFEAIVVTPVLRRESSSHVETVFVSKETKWWKRRPGRVYYQKVLLVDYSEGPAFWNSLFIRRIDDPWREDEDFLVNTINHGLEAFIRRNGTSS